MFGNRRYVGFTQYVAIYTGRMRRRCKVDIATMHALTHGKGGGGENPDLDFPTPSVNKMGARCQM